MFFGRMFISSEKAWQTGSLPRLLRRDLSGKPGEAASLPYLASRFSLFQGVAARHEDSPDNRFVVPPLGRKRQTQNHSMTLNASA